MLRILRPAVPSSGQLRLRLPAQVVGFGLLAGVAAVLMGGPARAQEPAALFASSVDLVEVYATVIDARGEPVTGLTAADFDVFEDGRRQEVSVFAAGEFPLTVALGIDRSWSMAGEPLRLARVASQDFLRQLRPGDRSMVLAIGAEADIIAPLTADRAAQVRAVGALDPWSSTALYDAMFKALDRLEPESGRQALVVFSDGADRYSRVSAADLVARARRSQALVYPVTLARTQVPLMAELAAITGGRSFTLRDGRGLDAALLQIARELRHQYLLGYVPTASDDAQGPGWRSIRLRLRSGERTWRVRGRDGYTAQ